MKRRKNKFSSQTTSTKFITTLIWLGDKPDNCLVYTRVVRSRSFADFLCNTHICKKWVCFPTPIHFNTVFNDYMKEAFQLQFCRHTANAGSNMNFPLRPSNRFAQTFSYNLPATRTYWCHYNKEIE